MSTVPIRVVLSALEKRRLVERTAILTPAADEYEADELAERGASVALALSVCTRRAPPPSIASGVVFARIPSTLAARLEADAKRAGVWPGDAYRAAVLDFIDEVHAQEAA